MFTGLYPERDATIERYAVAFNRGSDARLAGQPQTMNPYLGVDDKRYRRWLEGWEHMDSFWGHDAQWPVRPLPVLPAQAEFGKGKAKRPRG